MRYAAFALLAAALLLAGVAADEGGSDDQGAAAPGASLNATDTGNVTVSRQQGQAAAAPPPPGEIVTIEGEGLAQKRSGNPARPPASLPTFPARRYCAPLRLAAGVDQQSGLCLATTHPPPPAPRACTGTALLRMAMDFKQKSRHHWSLRMNDGREMRLKFSTPNKKAPAGLKSMMSVKVQGMANTQTSQQMQAVQRMSAENLGESAQIQNKTVQSSYLLVTDILSPSGGVLPNPKVCGRAAPRMRAPPNSQPQPAPPNPTSIQPNTLHTPHFT
jgi:hypothetical protein